MIHREDNTGGFPTVLSAYGNSVSLSFTVLHILNLLPLHLPVSFRITT